jgi:hypothetical protein
MNGLPDHSATHQDSGALLDHGTNQPNSGPRHRPVRIRPDPHGYSNMVSMRFAPGGVRHDHPAGSAESKTEGTTSSGWLRPEVGRQEAAPERVSVVLPSRNEAA